jgi:hypothetical protein
VAPVASEIILRPRIEFKPIECDSLCADRHEFEPRTHLAVETVLVHAEIARRIAQANEPLDEGVDNRVLGVRGGGI